jgi:hypothetical protein
VVLLPGRLFLLELVQLGRALGMSVAFCFGQISLQFVLGVEG